MPWMRLITQVSRHQPELRQFKSLLVNSFSPVSKFGLQGNGLLNAQRRFQSSYPSSLGSRVRDTDEASEVAYLKELNYQNDPKKVIRLFLRQKSLHSNPSALSEYVKALVKMNRLDESLLLKTLQRGIANVEQPHGSGEPSSSRINHFMRYKLSFLDHYRAWLRITRGCTHNITSEKVQRLLDRAYNNAKTILTTHSRELHALANALLEEETLSGSQIKYLLAQVNSQQQQQTQHQQVIVTTQSGSQSNLVPPSTANQTGATVAVSTTPAKSTAIAPVGS